jgi:hypothetical protein
VSRAVTQITLRLRLPSAVSAAIGLLAVMAAVGALFPAVGHSIGKLDVPKSVDNLLGGADYGTVTCWFRSEIAIIYGPLVIGALAITGASAATAGGRRTGSWRSCSPIRSAAPGLSSPRPRRSPPSC